MKNKTLQIIEKYELIKKDAHIIVGLSGGPDSMCLFDLLFTIAEENPQLNWKIYAVHVNHKLREGAAEEDQKYVEEVCASRSVPCKVVETDCKVMASELGLSSEEAGRKARYDAFSEEALCIYKQLKATEAILPDEAAKEYNRKLKEKIVIALAHNANDQCETILFHLMRGSGVDGLAGMAHKRLEQNGFAVVRPVLDFSRKEIETYCRERNLNPRIDHTNSENTYTRNKIRNMLIPLLEENFNENITGAVNRLGRIASCDRDFLRSTAAEEYESARASDDVLSEKTERESFDIEKLKKLHKAIRIRIYTMALEHIGMEENVTFSKLEAVDDLIKAKSPSASADLSAEFKAVREYDKLTFVRNGTAEVSDGKWFIRQMSPSEYEKYRKEGRAHGAFSGVSIEQLTIRTRRRGDRIDIGSGFKKLQDFFVDEKLPKVFRDEVKVLAAGSNILWIMPSRLYSRHVMQEKGRFSASFKVKEDSSEPVIVLEKL